MGTPFDKISEKLAGQEEAVERAFEMAEQAIGRAEVAQQVEMNETLQNIFEEAVNPLASRFTKQDKKDIAETRPRIKNAEQERLERKLLPLDDLKDAADRFQRRNQEFKSQILQLLAEKAKECKNKEELRKLVDQFYTDPTIADDAFDFLLEVSRGDFNKMVQQAKDEHTAEFKREIEAGRNIAEEVMKAVDLKLGAPKTLRDLYRSITGNPREPVSLFVELSDRFAYKDLRKVLAFLFHSLGSDLKSQGPSIDRVTLQRLIAEVRSLQAILGVYQFFRGRMNLISSLFQKNALNMPAQLTFELLAKQFVLLLQERYPSSDKILQGAKRLGIEDWILAKIIVFSQMRDAIREVALHQLYRSIEHRNELYNSLIEALERLEEELDELLEKEEEDDEGEDSEQDEDQEKK
jgi:type III secretion protein W